MAPPIYYGSQKVAPSGIQSVYYGNTKVYEKDSGLPNYLRFTADAASTVYLSNTNNTPDCQYSLDGNTWADMPTSDATKLSLTAGTSIYLRGDNPTGFSKLSVYSSPTSYFVMTGSISASGSVMSLIDMLGEETAIPGNGCCFDQLFSGCAALTTAPELPATTLATMCYDRMFYGTSITEPPELPATTLQTYCYNSMFGACASLESAPELPAMSVPSMAYQGMFSGCTSLAEPPELPATSVGSNGYMNMFSGCTSLEYAPELPATTLGAYCYGNMFSGCTSITEPPELSAITLVSGCYLGMFKSCTSLESAPQLPATTLQTYCYKEMFNGCSSLKVANASASGRTQFFKCPSTIPNYAVTDMFKSTGGSYTSSPVANGTYYYY